MRLFLSVLLLAAVFCGLSALSRAQPVGEVLPGLAPVAIDKRIVCAMPIVSGVCEAYFPRFAFNASSGRCEPFVYGGCQGNANNFVELAECEKTCPAVRPPPPRIGCPPGQPPVMCFVAPCRFATCPAHPEATCVDDYCGGCHHRFVLPGGHVLTPAQCMAPAAPAPAPAPVVLPLAQALQQPAQRPIPPLQKACLLDIDQGPCRASVPRFAYNRNLKQCVPFVYGGCAGNANNFDTAAACEAHCPIQCPVPEFHCSMVPCLPDPCPAATACVANRCSGCGGLCVNGAGALYRDPSQQPGQQRP